MKIQLGVKTNGNFGGFPVGNDILSNFGISLGNPHMDYLYQCSAAMLPLLLPPPLLQPPHCQHGVVEVNFEVTSL